MLTPTNSKITVASHVFSHAGWGMYANPEINRRGLDRVRIYISRASRGMLQKHFEIFMP